MQNKLARFLNLTAKISSSAVIAFLLLFLIAHLFSPEDDMNFKTEEIIASIFFPFGVVLGMLVAWKKQVLGGLITIISMIIFMIIILVPRHVSFDRGSWIFVIIALPGLFSFLSGILKNH